MQERLNDAEFNVQRSQSENGKLQSENGKLQSENDKLQSENGKLQSENNKLEGQLNDSENARKKAEEEINKLQKQLEDSEKEKNLIQKQFIEEKEKSLIRGTIIANVKRGLIFNAQINLQENGSPLDASKSKYIVSTSDTEKIGASAYAKGEPITSLKQTTVDFGAKPGRYFVRALVVNKIGKSVELVSNPVTTSGQSMDFEYEGKAATVMMIKGSYKLEVWGASGGKSTGTRWQSDGYIQNKPGLGGLGGYSIGRLNLLETNKFYIFVGGEGKTAFSENERETSGGFPDGGGTKTGHEGKDTSVPGTGGGSTSIRLSSDSLYARIIVAGGGGGAGGDYYSNHGGVGGGANGGDCYYKSKLQNQGGGTQTGSSPGFGAGSIGLAGDFGKGANGLYRIDANSGGGGGGGWYGGGGGGYGGGTTCSSGGGGSGWIFTESSYNSWRSSDSSNSSKFILTNSHYLVDASTIPGKYYFPKTNGNGVENGHSGNGYAKITPE